MTMYEPLDRSLATLFADEAAAAAPPDLADRIVASTARLQPRPAWRARLDQAGSAGGSGRSAQLASRPAARPWLLVALALMLAATVGVALWAGSRPPVPLVFPAGTWEAPKDGLSFGLPSGATKETLLIDSTPGTRSLRVTEEGFVVGTSAFVSNVMDASPFEVELTITSVTPLGGRGFEPGTPVSVDGRLLAACRLGDIGRYRWSLAAEGSVLTLQRLGDACPSREAVLARTWTLVRTIFVPAGSLTTPATTALLRPDGQVVIFGGKVTAENGLGSLGGTPESILLYDPATQASREIGTTAAGVSFAIQLDDGRVLAIELEAAPFPGSGGPGSSAAELINPDSGQVTSLGLTPQSHLIGAGVQLADGRVLLVGDANGTTEAELFDPVTGRFSATGSTSKAMMQPTATLLADGRVLVVGERERVAELYDPATGTFTPTGAMSGPHEDFTATLLRDGRVLIVGGWATNGTVVDGNFFPSEPARLGTTGEIYDPATGQFSQVGPMIKPRVYHFAVLLADGRVLIGGGSSSTRADVGSGGIVDPVALDAELFDPVGGAFSRTGALSMPRFGAGAVRLLDGRVLIVGSVQPAGGGTDPDPLVASSLEIFQ